MKNSILIFVVAYHLGIHLDGLKESALAPMEEYLIQFAQSTNAKGYAEKEITLTLC